MTHIPTLLLAAYTAAFLCLFTGFMVLHVLVPALISIVMFAACFYSLARRLIKK